MACVVLCAYRRAYALDRAAAARRRRLAPGRGRSVKCTNQPPPSQAAPELPGPPGVRIRMQAIQPAHQSA